MALEIRIQLLLTLTFLILIGHKVTASPAKSFVSNLLQFFNVIEIDVNPHHRHESYRYSNDLINQEEQKREQLAVCCNLGHMAGDKGFICNSWFYQPRIRERNRNRPHPRGRLSDADMHLIREFETCSQDQETRHKFDKCCLKGSRESSNEFNEEEDEENEEHD